MFPESRDVSRVIDLAHKCETAGLHGLFLGSGFGFDPITALAVAGAQTTSVMLGTAVVPTWPRHPIVTAQQAATANAVSNGRFRLGVGPSHEPVMKMYGIPFERPIRHVREYLTIVKALLADGRVSFKGSEYSVKAFLDVADAGTPPVLLAALHEQMCRTAGALADGVLVWLAPSSYIADVVVPAVRAGAESVGRPAPPVIAEIPVVLSNDLTAVREIVRADLGIYPHMPFYADMLMRAGVPGAADATTGGWSDSMIDAVIPWGDEDVLAKAAASYVEAGADEVVFSPFGSDDSTLTEVLGGIARG